MVYQRITEVVEVDQTIPDLPKPWNERPRFGSTAFECKSSTRYGPFPKRKRETEDWDELSLSEEIRCFKRVRILSRTERMKTTAFTTWEDRTADSRFNVFGSVVAGGEKTYHAPFDIGMNNIILGGDDDATFSRLTREPDDDDDGDSDPETRDDDASGTSIQGFPADPPPRPRLFRRRPHFPPRPFRRDPHFPPSFFRRHPPPPPPPSPANSPRPSQQFEKERRPIWNMKYCRVRCPDCGAGVSYESYNGRVDFDLNRDHPGGDMRRRRSLVFRRGVQTTCGIPSWDSGPGQPASPAWAGVGRGGPLRTSHSSREWLLSWRPCAVCSKTGAATHARDMDGLSISTGCRTTSSSGS